MGECIVRAVEEEDRGELGVAECIVRGVEEWEISGLGLGECMVKGVGVLECILHVGGEGVVELARRVMECTS